MALLDTVEDFAIDVKEKVGNKGFYLLLAGAAGLGIYSFIKASNSGGATTYVAPTTYEGYPEAGANANVIMDSVNKQIESSQDEILSALGEHDSHVTEQITGTNTILKENFEATNNYIQEGIDSMTDLSEKIDDVANKPVYSSPVYVYTSPVEEEKSAETKKPAATTPAAKPVDNTIKYTTKAGLNTNTSIVDALKAAGQASDFNSRAELYYANGGTGTYTGSSKQNVSMLNQLKAGTLEKAN